MAEAAPYEERMADATRGVYDAMQQAVLRAVWEHEAELFGERSRRWRAAPTPRAQRAESLAAVARIFDRSAWISEFTRVYGAQVTPALVLALRSMLGRLSDDAVAAIDVTDPAVVEFVRTRGFDFASGVTDTVRGHLRTALEKAIANGDGAVAFARRVEALFEDARAGRANTIARTEISAAQQWGRYQAAVRSVAVLARIGKRPKLMWLSCRDERVRDTHVDVDGTVVEVGELFAVGVCEMLHPLDAVTCQAAEEIINCRCVISVSVVNGVLAATAEASSPAPIVTPPVAQQVAASLAAVSGGSQATGTAQIVAEVGDAVDEGGGGSLSATGAGTSPLVSAQGAVATAEAAVTVAEAEAAALVAASEAAAVEAANAAALAVAAVTEANEAAAALALLSADATASSAATVEAFVGAAVTETNAAAATQTALAAQAAATTAALAAAGATVELDEARKRLLAALALLALLAAGEEDGSGDEPE